MSVGCVETIDPPESEFNDQVAKVQKWLEALADPAHLVELRALKVGGKTGRTHAGFFDCDNLYTLAWRSLALNRKTGSIYWTINPVDASILNGKSGVKNEARLVYPGESAEDESIVRRRFILIDVDPARLDADGKKLKGENSSTDSEKAQAMDVVRAVRDYLNSEGWPDPVLADSGNGFHLLYRIDLPSDDWGIVRGCLYALDSKFSTPLADVDTSVHNASRITALYGTWKRKGVDSPDRPHRQSAVIEIPDPLEVVSLEKLQALADQGPPEMVQTRTPGESLPSEYGSADAKLLKRISAYVSKCSPAVSGQGGHKRTFNVACTLVQKLALSKDEARPIFQDWNRTCDPPWSDHELNHKLDDAEKEQPRGELRAKWFEEDRRKLEEWKAQQKPTRNRRVASRQTKPSTNGHSPPADDGDSAALMALADRESGATDEPLEATNGHDPDSVESRINELAENPPSPSGGARNEIPPPDDEPEYILGEVDPKTGKLILSQSRTLPTAEAFVRLFHTHPEGQTIRSYAGELYEWAGNRFATVEDDGIRGRVQPWLHQASIVKTVDDVQELHPFPANPTTVEAALKTIRAHVHMPLSCVPPVWLAPGNHPPAREILASPNHLLHIPTQTLLKPSPLFFNTNAIEFDPDFTAPVPHKWFKFLQELFDDDMESLDLLQEWFGYCLSGDTSLQKMMLIVGPRRSGKGTINRVLQKLLGSGNVTGPTTSSLATQFGLQPLVGKSLACVSDARFNGKEIGTVVERLLLISGEDPVSIDRKYLGSVTMKLPTRFLFLTNEVPRLMAPT